MKSKLSQNKAMLNALKSQPYFGWGCDKILFGIKTKNGQPRLICDYPLFFGSDEKNKIFVRLIKMQFHKVEQTIEFMSEKEIKSQLNLIEKENSRTYEKITITKNNL